MNAALPLAPGAERGRGARRGCLAAGARETTTGAVSTGAVSGSEGNLFTVEYRHDFGFAGIPGRFQGTVFADTGRVEVYKNPFSTGVNSGRLSSAGLGLHWAVSGDWVIAASAAHKIGATPELLQNADTKTRVWVQVQKGFN